MERKVTDKNVRLLEELKRKKKNAVLSTKEKLGNVEATE